MTGTRPWRLLRDAAGPGAANMARDEALLSRAAGPVLRLYGWDPPCLSLGRGQPAEGAHDPRALARLGFGLARRPTGGRAVLHAAERTYAVVGLLRSETFPGGVLDTYRRIAAALVHALRALGLPAVGEAEPGDAPPGRPSGPVCFDRAGAYEISVGGRKVVGSAQLRRRGAFLQHGSILLRADAAATSEAIGTPVDPARLAGLEDLLGRAVPDADVDAAVVSGFARAFEAALEPSTLTPEEREAEARLRTLHASPEWVREGRVGPVRTRDVLV